jgi:D-alanyl-D-alanine carboxypeptidase (penicillin-binding protein 5/6)
MPSSLLGRLLSLLVLCVLLVGPGGGLATPAAAAGPRAVSQDDADPGSDEPASVSSPEPGQATEAPAPPKITAASAIAVDIDADQVLYALAPDERRAPASTTKMATALVVRRHVEDLEGTTVTVEEGDTVEPPFSTMGLQAGDVLTVQDLLYGLLLPSGNDAAKALARLVGAQLPGGEADPIATFVQAMNDLCAELGAKNTTFVNPAGEDQEGHLSTARDLAILAGALLDDPALAEIVRTPSIEVTYGGEAERRLTLENTNQLLGETGIIGVKTGSTDAAGGCLVVGAAYSERNRVVLVVLGSDLEYEGDAPEPSKDARFLDMLAMIQGLNEDYDWLAADDPEAVPGLREALAAWEVTMEDAADLVLPADQDGELTFKLRLGPAAKPGEEVGRVLFFAGSTQIAERPIYQV